MKIYTRTGDVGTTSLFGGTRVLKDHQRIEAYGTVDELNAAIGVARSVCEFEPVERQLECIQNELFAIGAELAATDPEERGLKIIGPRHIERLEGWIDAHEEQLPALKNFILPAGSTTAANLHLARAICRRAERRVVSLYQNDTPETPASHTGQDVVVYLNRLSDLLFVMTRVVNSKAGFADVVWIKPVGDPGSNREN